MFKSLASSDSSRGNSVMGKNVVAYFRESGDASFRIKDVRYYPLNVGAATDTVVENANRNPLLWLFPPVWMWGAAHVAQKTVARITTGSANEHWYVVMDGPDGQFVLEYADKGLEVNPVAAVDGRANFTYHLDERWYSSYRSARAGRDVAAFLERFDSHEYHAVQHNCQDFVKQLTEFF